MYKEEYAKPQAHGDLGANPPRVLKEILGIISTVNCMVTSIFRWPNIMSPIHDQYSIQSVMTEYIVMFATPKRRAEYSLPNATT
jgi:hypothetical protein